MPAEFAEALARRLGISRDRLLPVLDLLDQGFSPAFIVHYRKALSGSMDETTMARVMEARADQKTLEGIRTNARRVAEAAGGLTDDLARRIDAAEEPEAIEDLVRPLRPKRRTAGAVALDRGLAPLAQYAADGPADGPDLAVKAAEFVNPEKEIRSPEEALAGAGHILAERVANEPRLRAAVRTFVWEKGVLKSQAAKEGDKGAAEFRSYFAFQEPLAHLPPHRVLALNRGERNRILKITFDIPADELRTAVLPLVAPAGHRFLTFLHTVVTDALARLMLPAIDREIRRTLTDRADAHAVDVFASNLRSLLLARPVRGKRVLAIQPGYRTGCKAAVLDAAGALVGETIVYPLEPQKKWDEGKAELVLQIQKHGVDVVAIGNGTGCREIEQLVSEMIEQHALAVQYTLVSEAGAAVYADSPAAHVEFPNVDAAIRATVSIGRRLQDPLVELVKIDPRAIGVGLYQHDVNQGRLKSALELTMQTCVAAVGADAATASAAMLAYVPGLTEAHAAALIAARTTAPLAGREALRTLPGWDEKAFTQAAGFLQIHGANPLDATPLHPEHYAAAERLLAHLGHAVADLAQADAAADIRRRLTGQSLEPLAAEIQVALPDLLDVVGAIQHPDADPRQQHHGPIFRKKMREITDLRPGQWIKGTVRNVVDFGAFVDIGLKEDGLVHISQFSKRYVRNPLKFLHVGDIVDVRIVSVDPEKHRISLTLIPEEQPKKREPRPAGEGAEAAAAGEGGAPRPPRQPRQPRRGPRPAGRPATAEGAAAGGGAPASGEGAPRPPAAGRAPSARPPRSAAPRSGESRSDRPQGGRGPRDRRPERSGPPRIIVSKPKAPTEERPPDEAGRPKLRWAYYESDPEKDPYESQILEQPSAETPEAAEPEAAAPEVVTQPEASPPPEAAAPEVVAPPEAAPPSPEQPSVPEQQP